jgi:hypothetical protein
VPANPLIYFNRQKELAMNIRNFIAGGCLLILSVFPFSYGYADFGSIFKKVQETPSAGVRVYPKMKSSTA